MDGQLLAIGSMNLDLRSELQNTEIALLIRSRKLAAVASKQIETGMRDLAWHVEKDAQVYLACAQRQRSGGHAFGARHQLPAAFADERAWPLGARSPAVKRHLRATSAMCTSAAPTAVCSVSTRTVS